MSIDWPGGFPKALREGYSIAPGNAVARTDFGYATRTRRLYAGAPDSFRVAWIMTAAQWAQFQGFWAYELAQGTKWFSLPLRAAGVSQTLEVNFHGAAPTQTLSLVDGVRIEGVVSTRGPTVMSAEDYAGL